MRILDEDKDSSIKRATLLLTAAEAKSLHEQLGELILKHKTHHIHIEDEEFERQITVAIYSENILSQFNERSQKLIEKDE